MSFEPFKITLKNYRCFDQSKPLEFEVRPGITALIGRNNTGKSTVLRLFHEFRSLLRDFRNVSSGRLQSALAGGLDVGLRGENALLSPDMFPARGEHPGSLSISLMDPIADGDDKTVTRLDITFARPVDASSRIELTCFNRSTPMSMDGLSGANQIDANTGIVIDGKKSETNFGPIFRCFDVMIQAVYFGPMRNATTFSSNDKKVEGATFRRHDLVLNETLVEAWRRLKTGKDGGPDQADKAIRIEAEIQRIFGFRSLQINPSDDSSCLQIIADGVRNNIQEMGTGLVQFVVLMINAALKPSPLMLLDEPELNLHASLQPDLVQTLASHCNGNLIYTTHNIGLPRVTNARTFAMCRTKSGHAYLKSFAESGALTELLGALSFAHSPEIGYEKVLLVEGRTDVLTIREFLKFYGKEHKILILPLGGSAYTNTKDIPVFELSEFKRMSKDVSILLDSDKESDSAPLKPHIVKFKASCEDLGFRVHVLERTELENYLAESAIQKVRGKDHRALLPFEKFKQLKPKWDKDQNWLIARQMSRQDIDKTDLGAFLKSL